MTRIFRLALVFVLFSPIVGTAHGQPPAAVGAILQRATEYMAAWNAHDTNKLMSYYDDLRGWFVNGAAVIGTKDSLRAYTQRTFDARATDAFKWDRTKVTMLGDNMALFQGVYGGRMTFKDGRILEFRANAVQTMLFEKRGAEWKITGLHASSDTGVPVAK